MPPSGKLSLNNLDEIKKIRKTLVKSKRRLVLISSGFFISGMISMMYVCMMLFIQLNFSTRNNSSLQQS